MSCSIRTRFNKLLLRLTEAHSFGGSDTVHFSFFFFFFTSTWRGLEMGLFVLLAPIALRQKKVELTVDVWFLNGFGQACSCFLPHILHRYTSIVVARLKRFSSFFCLELRSHGRCRSLASSFLMLLRNRSLGFVRILTLDGSQAIPHVSHFVKCLSLTPRRPLHSRRR